MDAEADGVCPKPTELAHDAEVTRQRQAEPGTDGRALHGGYERQGENRRCGPPVCRRLPFVPRSCLAGGSGASPERKSAPAQKDRPSEHTTAALATAWSPANVSARARSTGSVSRLWGGRRKVTTAMSPSWSTVTSFSALAFSSSPVSDGGAGAVLKIGAPQGVGDHPRPPGGTGGLSAWRSQPRRRGRRVCRVRGGRRSPRWRSQPGASSDRMTANSLKRSSAVAMSDPGREKRNSSPPSRAMTS